MRPASRTAGFGLLACGLVLFLAAAATAADLDAGKNLYLSRCLFCHGEAGKGDGPAARGLKPPPTNLATAEYWRTASVERMKGIIADGIPGSAMLPFKSALRPDQIDTVVDYIQTFKPAP